jgi:hypothetical protein
MLWLTEWKAPYLWMIQRLVKTFGGPYKDIALGVTLCLLSPGSGSSSFQIRLETSSPAVLILSPEKVWPIVIISDENFNFVALIDSL